MMGLTAHNTANNVTPSFEMDYRGRSMPFGAKKIDLLIGAKRHGVVCRDVSCHAHRERTYAMTRYIHRFVIAILAAHLIEFSGCKNEEPVPPSQNICDQRNTTVTFGNRTWTVRSSSSREEPGKNFFSDSKCNVWVENGELHLRITYRDGRWYCAEVTSQSVGYGEYTFYVSSRVDQLDKNVVLGLFTYDNNTCNSDAYSEIDIEFAKWGPCLLCNSQFSVQPTNDGLKPPLSYSERFNQYTTVLFGNNSTHVFNWQPNIVTFASYHGYGKDPNVLIHSWSFGNNNQGRRRMCKPSEDPSTWTWSQYVTIPSPSSTTFVDINLWLNDPDDNGGDPPTDGKEVEVVIHDFNYTPSHPIPPTVTTAAITGVTSNSASGGGNVTSQGSSEVTARGVCWSTSQNPTTADSKTIDGSGTGSFTSTITGLSPSTPYYVRAYATNSTGTGYGSQVSFTTAGTPNYLINDDFESYAVNTFPSSGGWTLLHNGAGNQYQIVTTSQAHSGSQSMQLKGKNWWAADMGKSLSFSQSVFFCEVWARASASATGQLEDRGEIRFAQVTSGNWTFYGAVYLSAENGQIMAYAGDRINNQIAIQSYNANQWYKLKLKIDIPQQKMSVWVDDILRLNNQSVTFPTIGFNSFQLTAEHGNTTFWYDDLSVWKE